jgi:MYXO-CTERM domain-containing protein
MRLTPLAVAALVAVTTFACGAPPGGGGGEAVSSSSAAASTAFANDQTAYDFFLGKGLTNFQAAGIVGNLDQESGVDPGAVQAGGPGRGIAQWSVGGRWDTDANDNVLAYATKEGEASSSLTLQLEFIWYELTTFSGYGLGALQGSTNVTDATVDFETDFEGCGECDQSTRISYAESVLAAYGSADYGAAYVSQSFPLASSALQMVGGQTVAATLTMKNTGTKSWDTSTHLGTTQPRDRTSVFAESTWLAPDRPAGVTGTVAPGADFEFKFNFHAPNTPGTYFEYFNLVEEGVAWFSDPGQGGPADNDIEVQIVVTAAPETDAGTVDPESDGGAVPAPTGPGAPPSASGDDGGTTAVVIGSVPDGEDAGAGGPSFVGAPATGPSSSSGGCSVTSEPAGGAAAFGWLALGLVALRARRRR